MSAEPKNIDVLQNLEFAVVNVWGKHREMSDHVAARAYEAAFERYRAESRGQQPKACALAGLDREVFEAVVQMCECRLGRSSDIQFEGKPMPSIPVSELVDCLRQLRKSVERHTKSGGRQGYLTFVSQFVQ
jgi:hypothetical protein